jgi:hypothetical protein
VLPHLFKSIENKIERGREFGRHAFDHGKFCAGPQFL